MPAYLVFDADGLEVKRGGCPESMLSIMAGEGQTVITYDPTPHDPDTFMLQDGELVAAPIIVIPHEEPAYLELRAAAYPYMADQLDQIYHEGLDAWKATIAAIKAEYPKPNQGPET